jgi:hypothetical protein
MCLPFACYAVLSTGNVSFDSVDLATVSSTTCKWFLQVSILIFTPFIFVSPLHPQPKLLTYGKMKQSHILWLTLITTCHAFLQISSNYPSKSTLSSAVVDYETVKVDLTDGRDYPIYIGAGFSETEGEFRYLFQFGLSF